MAGVATLDSQTVMAVQSLLEPRNMQETVPADDEDVFQCGRCKNEFTSLAAFVSHKQSRCTGIKNSHIGSSPMTSLAISSHCQDAGSAGCGIIYTTDATQMTNSLNKQVGSNTYMVPLQSFAQGMVLTDDMISFQAVDPMTATIQLPIHCGGSQFLSPNGTTTFVSDKNHMSSSSPYCTYVSSSYAVDDTGCVVQSQHAEMDQESGGSALADTSVVAQLDVKHLIMPGGSSGGHGGVLGMSSQLDLKQMILAVPSSQDIADAQYMSADGVMMSSDGAVGIPAISRGGMGIVLCV
jgi:hypothetical protein